MVTISSATEIDAREVGRHFASLLREELGGADYARLRERVRAQSADERSCPSHDFCDANVVMMGAVSRTTGLDHEGFFDLEGYEAVWIDAWNFWRASVREER